MDIIAGIRLRKNSRITDLRVRETLRIKPGDQCVVQGEDGKEAFGDVLIGPMRVEWIKAKKKPPLRLVLRQASERDLDLVRKYERLEKEAFDVCRQRIGERGLFMKLIEVEFTFDGSKAIFYFTANKRVDFRELIRDLAHFFHIRIEMRQIGVRDEARMLGGFGICGRNLCCNSFLCEFQPVTVSMAKEQNLTLDPAKISGICGRLMCCLTFELDCLEKFKKRAKPSKKGLPPGVETKELVPELETAQDESEGETIVFSFSECPCSLDHEREKAGK